MRVIDQQPRCRKCSSTEGLLVNSRYINTAGIEVVYHACRGCNNARAKVYRSTDDGKKKMRDAVYGSIERHRSKQAARAKVRQALIAGEIKRPYACSLCRQPAKLDAHHNDYDRPLDVEWLCRSCHANRHKEIRSVQAAEVYR